MNTTRNFLYKKLFAISLTGMLLSSPISMLAEAAQSSDAQSEPKRSVSPANIVLLSKIHEIVAAGNSRVVTAITGGNPANNLGTVIPELQAAIEELQDSADDLEVAVADLSIAILDLDAEIDALSLVVADIPTNTELTAAVLVGTNATILELQGAGTSNDLTTLATSIDALPTNAELTTALADLPTNTELTAAIGVGTAATILELQGAGTSNDLTTLTAGVAAVNAQNVTTLANLAIVSDNVDSIVSTLGVGGLATSAQAVAIQGATFDTATDSLEAISNKIGNPLVAADTSTLAFVIGNPNDAISQATSIVGVLNYIEGSAFATSTDSLEAISNKIGDPGVDTSVSTNIANIYSRIGAPVLGSISADIAAKATSVQAAAIQGNTFTSSTDSLEAISDKIGLPLLNNDTSTVAFILAAIQKQAALTQVVAAASNPAITTIAVTDGNDAAFNAQIDILLPLIATAIATPTNGNIVNVQTQIDAVPTLTGTALTSGYSIIAINAGINQLEAAVDNWLAFYPA